MKLRAIFVIPGPALVLALMLGGASARADATRAQGDMLNANQLCARGKFEASLPAWREALQDYTTAGDAKGELTASIGLADALQELGQYPLAEDTLEKADKLAKTGTDQRLQVRVESSLGTLYMFASDPEDAEGLLTKSVMLARQIGDDHLIAMALNNLANLHSYEKSYDQATREYEEGAKLAQAGGETTLALKMEANLTKSAVDAASWDDAKKGADQIVEEAKSAPDSHDKATALLGAGKAFVDVFIQSDTKDDALRLKAYAAYEAAAQTARRIGDDRARSYACGYEAELYQMEGKPEEALTLARHAASLAQNVNSSDILFRWQWQIARILALQHQLEPAISAYQATVATLQTIRHDMSLHFGNSYYHSSFREAAGSVYFELADLLLQRADRASADADIQADLLAARDTTEELKAAELEDYFQDDCANLLKSKITKIATVSSTAAIIYIIPLADRTEVLVQLPTGRIERVKSPVTSAQLEQTATDFRFNLEKRTTDEYLAQATQLYGWLIKPIEPFIGKGGIDTLVFVPDGALRTVPMAALNDGAHFLIEKYAVATAPGLTLIEPKPLTPQKSTMIIDGLSEGVQGFPPLDYVPEEVKELEALYGGPELLNKQFSEANVAKEFDSDSYTIVHIASHGHFDSDERKTFILTYDGKLSLDQLETMIRPSQIRDKPVELLTLSACQTAAGDDRAALGLAGVAVKAGARSALATLWFVNDETSSLLIGDFYKNLHNVAGISKARALQQAQIKLLSDPRYGHPCYWAPYQLIGNWL
jgi:CHAT domain-containing protein